MTKREVMIHMLTSRVEMNGSMFCEDEELEEEERDEGQLSLPEMNSRNKA